MREFIEPIALQNDSLFQSAETPHAGDVCWSKQWKCNGNSGQTCIKTTFTYPLQMFNWKCNVLKAINKSSDALKYDVSV